MATKIITNQTEWKPVKIEMEFTNRQQLAVFVEMMGSSYTIAEVISKMSVVACDVTENMDMDEMERAIDQLVDAATWLKLKNMVNI